MRHCVRRHGTTLSLAARLLSVWCWGQVSDGSHGLFQMSTCRWTQKTQRVQDLLNRRVLACVGPNLASLLLGKQEISKEALIAELRAEAVFGRPEAGSHDAVDESPTTEESVSDALSISPAPRVLLTDESRLALQTVPRKVRLQELQDEGHAIWNVEVLHLLVLQIA